MIDDPLRDLTFFAVPAFWLYGIPGPLAPSFKRRLHVRRFTNFG